MGEREREVREREVREEEEWREVRVVRHARREMSPRHKNRFFIVVGVEEGGGEKGRELCQLVQCVQCG